MCDLLRRSLHTAISSILLSQIFLCLTAYAEWCQSHGQNQKKQCPNYGDAEDDTFCCASEVRPGDFYCCNQAEKLQQDSSGNNFSEFLPVILGSLFGAVFLSGVVIGLSCFFCPQCPWYKWKRKSREASRYSSTTSYIGSSVAPQRPSNPYVPVNTAEPKPSPFEAPPPYPYAQEYPTQPPPVQQNTTQWEDYCLENDANSLEERYLAGSSRLTSPTLPKSQSTT